MTLGTDINETERRGDINDFLETDIGELGMGPEISFLGDKQLILADADLRRKDETPNGSPFFSKKELARLREFIRRNETMGWRLPTLAELTYISASVEFQGRTTSCSVGESLLEFLGEEKHTGAELIAGSIRTPVTGNMTCYWSDSVLMLVGEAQLEFDGIMKISPNKVSFEVDRSAEILRPHNSEQRGECGGGFYDHPDFKYAYCVRLVREV